MLHIRTTKTSSGATAVQVVRYVRRKPVIVKHVGSAHTPKERAALIDEAHRFIERRSGQIPLWKDSDRTATHWVDLRSCTYHGVLQSFAHEILCHAIRTIEFRVPPLLRDLAIMRIIEPCSKRRSLKYLEQHLDIHYRRQMFYDKIPALLRRKRAIEQCAVAFAKSRLSFDCALVLYDVTTLYFESFREDEPENDKQGLRKTGFSKDNKPQQPQIVVGLLVTAQGFPLGYEAFRGNTFEGHTMLSVLRKFCRKHTVRSCTVVADAAMLSMENVAALRKNELSYIVGARVANLPRTRIATISSALHRKEGAMIRIPTQHGDLICSFSMKRYRKDKHEMEQQIAHAKKLVATGKPGRHAKFIRKQGGRYTFNDALAAKAKQLLGIKGYYTNIPQNKMSDADVIEHYRNLWQVEQAFRMAKSDLEMRPIFHRMEDTIRVHLLICFMALAVGKYLEITAKRSLRQIVDALMSVTDAMITDPDGRQAILRSELTEDVRSILEDLSVSH